MTNASFTLENLQKAIEFWQRPQERQEFIGMFSPTQFKGVNRELAGAGKEQMVEGVLFNPHVCGVPPFVPHIVGPLHD